MKLEFARGDSYEKGIIFKDKESEETITEEFDEVFFTVKKSANEHDYLFQKKKSTGGITYDGEGHYTIHIVPNDTNDLRFADYDCDIEVKNNSGYKKTFYGTLKLTKEVTHQYNE